MTNVIFVGLGGFVGAILRYLLGLIPVRQTPFPIITLSLCFRSISTTRLSSS